MVVNPELQVQMEDYWTQFQQEGFVVIPNFLEPDLAEEIYQKLSAQDESFWKKIILIEDKLISCQEQKNGLTNEQLEKLRNLAQYQAAEGNFSYCYAKNVNHIDPQCDCFGCGMLKQFASDQNIISTITAITGISLSRMMGELFFSRYSEDDFLTLHTDYDKGKVAFIINFTKEWQPFYGGMLHLLEPNKIDVQKVIVPKFNQLTLLRIPDDKEGYPHFVSPVASYVKKHRYSLAGWFT